MHEFKKRANGNGGVVYLGKRKEETLCFQDNNWKRCKRYIYKAFY